MKTTLIFLVSAVVVLLAGCGRSAEEAALDQQLTQTKIELARQETRDEIRRAQASAKREGAKFASDGILTKLAQCSSRLATERMGQSPVLRRFPEEVRQPFVEGCVAEAGKIARNQQLAREEARRVAAAEKEKARLAAVKRMKLAAAAELRKTSAKKR
ncbi:MAG: hypothetical protein Q7S05_01920 [bacterium]|nr:hypothetical protein [bacterium]